MIKKIVFSGMIGVMGLMSGNSDELIKNADIKEAEKRLARGETGGALHVTAQDYSVIPRSIRGITCHPYGIRRWNKLDKTPQSLVERIASYPEQIVLLKKLLQAGAYATPLALHNALVEGSADAVQLLLTHGGNPNKEAYIQLPLKTCMHPNVKDPFEKATILLSHGACINKVNKKIFKSSALYTAVESLYRDSNRGSKWINFLLSRGSDPYIPFTSLYTFQEPCNSIDCALQDRRNKLADYLMVAPQLRKNAIQSRLALYFDKKFECFVPEIVEQIVKDMIVLEAD